MSNLSIEGQVVKILDLEQGVSKAGREWKKQSFVINTGAQFNPEVCFSVFGEEKVAQMQSAVKVGAQVEVFFNISSREFNNRYFHNLDAWRIEGKQVTAPDTPPFDGEEPALTGSDEDDLPF